MTNAFTGWAYYKIDVFGLLGKMQNNILEVPLVEHNVYMYMIPITTSLLAYFKK